MQKFITSLAAMLMCGAANAAQKCIFNIPGNARCGADTNITKTYPEWSEDCIKSDEGDVFITVRGIAICGTEYAQQGKVADTVSIDTSKDTSGTGNRFCWCKMIYPAESKWISGGLWANDFNECTVNCPKACADINQTTGAYFNNLIH